MLTAHKATQSCNVRATRTWPTSMLTCLRTDAGLGPGILCRVPSTAEYSMKRCRLAHFRGQPHSSVMHRRDCCTMAVCSQSDFVGLASSC